MIAKLALIDAVARLRAAGVEAAAGDARLLLAHAMGLPAARLSLHTSDALSAAQLSCFEAAITARAKRQPVSKITGQRLFWGLPFAVTPDILDPRPETEILVAEALRLPFRRMLDLGTGSGCILLACLNDQPEAEGVGGDVSVAALAVAQGNARALGLAARAQFRPVDWTATGWAQELGQFDLITANPPYIAAAEMSELAPEVLNWDPHLALTPGGDGLDPYRAIAPHLPALLSPAGRVLFEIGPTQGAAVMTLLAAAGLVDLRLLQDFDGRDRVVAGQRAG